MIPDGKGAWKKTDPRKDRDKVTYENKRLSGRVLELVRMAKYWAKISFGSFVSSYLVETMTIYYCTEKYELSEYSDWKFEDLLKYFQTSANGSVYDIKGIQGNINNLTYDQRVRFSNTAKADYNNASNAHYAEMNEKNNRKAIEYWKKVFGKEFPSYGDEV